MADSLVFQGLQHAHPAFLTFTVGMTRVPDSVIPDGGSFGDPGWLNPGDR